MSSCTLSLAIEGEELLLHPARALIWPRRRTVIVADTHFGKSAHFGRHGIAVPAGADEDDRERLNRLIAESDAKRLIILGDFLHAPLAEGSLDADALRTWIDGLDALVDVHVIAGNHDRGGSWTLPKSLHWWQRSWVDPPFRFIHDADRVRPGDSQPLFTLSGHVHPVVRLRQIRKSTMRVPVFWHRVGALILPSFGQFTGGFAVKPAAGERVYAVGPSSVVEVGG
jgi:DNA ligase-associated metallophosphoesterase